MNQNNNETSIKKKPMALTIFISIILSILLFISSISAFVLYDFRAILQPRNIERMIENLPYDQVLNEIFTLASLDKEEFYQQISEEYGIELNDDSLNEFLEKSTIAPAISEKIEGFTNDFFKGSAEFKISKDEVSKFLKDNTEVLSEEAGIPLDDAELQKIVDSMFEADEIKLFDTVSLEEEMPELYRGMTMIFSAKTLTILLVICGILVLLMVLNSWSQASVGVGVISLFIGLLAAAFSILASFAVPLTIEFLGESLAETLFGGFVSDNRILAIVFIALAIVLFVLRSILLRRMKRKA